MLAINPIRAVCVYCSSSSEVDPAYLRAAREMGAAIAAEGWTLVYGGNVVGSMGEVAQGARSAGGKVVGVSPRLFSAHHDLLADELVITDSMRERKLILEQRADAFVALPGGIGTYEELFEQVVARQLRYHDKPVIALDLNGFYQPLRDLFAHGTRERFIKLRAGELLAFAPTVADVIARLRSPHHITAPLEALSHEAAGGH